MSDYIRKEQAIDVLKETGIIQDNDLGHLVVDEINRIPTLDEKEIIRKAMERILTRLEVKKRSDGTESDREWGKYIGYVDAIKIVKEEGGIE